VKPLLLPANTPPQFYRGGRQLAKLRGARLPDRYRPEDWVASPVPRFGESNAGLTVLPDGRTLVEVLAADPDGWLGPAHVAEYGADPALLVKLLDAGERLPVHCHPDRRFARAHLASGYGKTEAWIVIAAGSGACVHLGFREDLEPDRLAGWVADQETSALLAATNRLPVAPGDAVLVPAGIPHAIGEGVFIVELQEPTDYSVLLEWEGFRVDPEAGHLGLGWELALACVDRSAWSAARLSASGPHATTCSGRAPGDCFPRTPTRSFGRNGYVLNRLQSWTRHTASSSRSKGRVVWTLSKVGRWRCDAETPSSSHTRRAAAGSPAQSWHTGASRRCQRSRHQGCRMRSKGPPANNLVVSSLRHRGERHSTWPGQFGGRRALTGSGTRRSPSSPAASCVATC
jgi:mannose-6-phosphate isomerase